MSKRTLHCWTDKREWAEKTFGSYSTEYFDTYKDGGNPVCMLPDGHDGPHGWTQADEIVVAFEPAKDAGTEKA